MARFTTLFLFILTLLFCQCTKQGKNDDEGRDYPSKETFIGIDSCMSYMSSNPHTAHHMLDSIAEAKLMTRQRCDYFHAMVIFCGENNSDSALVICNRLLEDGEFGDDKFLEEEICVLASNITSGSKRHFETLKYANRGIAICHGDERMRGDEATLMARVGAAEQELGRVNKARETYNRALKLLKPNESFGDLVALISLQKKQASLHNEAKEYDKVISIYHDILNTVERFDKDPSFVTQRPESMKESGAATHDFADFYQSQIYGMMAKAFREKIEQGLSSNAQADTDSVKAYMDKWSHTNGSQSPDNIVSVLQELDFAGKYAEYTYAIPQIKELFRSDSLVNEYVDLLTLLAKDAESKHDLKASNDYLQRAVAISDSIRQKDLLQELSEQMSLNMVQEQELARQDAENQLSRQQTINILQSIILAIVVMAGILIFLLLRKNKEKEQIIETTQYNLTNSKEEIQELVQQLETSKAEKAANNAKLLYEKIEQVMSEEQLYLNPNLDIKAVAEAVNSSRSVVSSCINSITSKPFRQWLSEYRLSLFERMLKEHLDVPIDILVMRCGYRDQSTFRRQFKATYGMTAGEFKRIQEEERKRLKVES